MLIIHFKSKVRTEFIATQHTQHKLKQSTAMLKQEQAKLSHLHQQLLTQQHKLLASKAHHTLLITSLKQHIANKYEILSHYRHDQLRLNTLLNHLSAHPSVLKSLHHISPPHTRQAFTNPLTSGLLTAEPVKQGLLFNAPEGERVNAVLPGKVIFSDWLNGYGLLLIVDHGNGLMSVYAHNQSLFKLLGAKVRAGEQIATVGHTGGLAKNGLYFELRRHGKVIPPGEWIS